MIETKLISNPVTVKGNLEASSAVHGTIFCHRKLSTEEIEKIEQMRYNDAIAYCQNVLRGKFVKEE